jgi:hypothetical protein
MLQRPVLAGLTFRLDAKNMKFRCESLRTAGIKGRDAVAIGLQRVSYLGRHPLPLPFGSLHDVQRSLAGCRWRSGARRCPAGECETHRGNREVLERSAKGDLTLDQNHALLAP